MRSLKTLALSLASTAALAAFAAPALADLWHDEQIMGRHIAFYSPSDLDRIGAAPTVIVFDDDARSGPDLAERFPVWHFATEQGFKLIYAGGTVEGAGGNGVPSHKALFPMALEMAVRTGSADPDNLYVVGYGDAAQRAYDFACANPDILRGIIAIDHEGAGGTFECADASGLFVLSVHDGRAIALSAGGTGPTRDTKDIDQVLLELKAAGATVQGYAVQGSDENFPSLAAKFHQQSGVSLEKLVALFVGRTIDK